jgi:hypothetical protein
MAITPNRFSARITGPARAAQVIPVHSQHTASMIAQASRVPRLAGLSIYSGVRGAATKGSKR